jgi:uncharacterized membrane protein
MNETAKRSLVKSFVYRLYTGFFITPITIYVALYFPWLQKKWQIALGCSLMEFVVKIPTYFLFERFFGLLKWGKK